MRIPGAEVAVHTSDGHTVPINPIEKCNIPIARELCCFIFGLGCSELGGFGGSYLICVLLALGRPQQNRVIFVKTATVLLLITPESLSTMLVLSGALILLLKFVA
ncbi:hypothetical protein B9Z19DRAFT_1131838 [Tuber borchii]|uniref:Uncharacterized protein n=1 Tax=Tuber borchii TaxID=42251 RepID=A0A2T6ZI47_TUBBO|nr:hypothetical protein B9Z19DRAFT_1131838 [Tuber borchii]